MKFKRLSAALLSLAMVCALSMAPVQAGYFPDVTDPEVTRAADTLRALGVVSGDENGNFKPNQRLDRASFCKMAIEVMGMGEQAAAQMNRTLFTDVGSTHWARGYINLAATMELENSPGARLMTGTGDGNFAPDRNITYQEAATMVLRMLGYAAEANASWPNGAIRQASVLELNKGLSLSSYTDPVTRGQAALLFYHLLSIPAKGTDNIYAASLGSVVKDAIILSTNSTVNGQSGWIVTTGNGRYRPAASVDEDLVGQRGDILLDKSGRFITLLTDDSQCVTIVVARTQGNYLYAANGTRYVFQDKTPVYTGNDDDMLEYSQVMPSLQAGDVATIYLKDNAVIGMFCNTVTIQSSFLVVESNNVSQAALNALTGGNTNYTIRKNGSSISRTDLKQYDVLTYDPVSRVITVCDVRLTCYYENASPSPSAPTSITAAGGNTFNVMSGAMDDLAKFKVGQPFTLLFTASGQVAGAISSGYTGNTGGTGSWNSGTTGSWNTGGTGSWNTGGTGSWNTGTTGSWNTNSSVLNEFFRGHGSNGYNNYGYWSGSTFYPYSTSDFNTLYNLTSAYGTWTRDSSGYLFTYNGNYNYGSGAAGSLFFYSGYPTGSNAYGTWTNGVFQPNQNAVASLTNYGYPNSNCTIGNYTYGYWSNGYYHDTSYSSGTGSWNTGSTGSWNTGNSTLDAMFYGYNLVSANRVSYDNNYGTWYYNNGSICFRPVSNEAYWQALTSNYGTWSNGYFYPNGNYGSTGGSLPFYSGYPNGSNTYGSWSNGIFYANTSNSSVLSYLSSYGCPNGSNAYGYWSNYVFYPYNSSGAAVNNGNAMGMVSSDGKTMSLLGTEVTLDLSNATNASQMHSQLASVYGSSNGKLTLTAVKLSTASGSLNTSTMRLGNLNVSSSVRIYDQGTTGNTLTPIALSALPVTVPVSQIKGYHADSTGSVDLIVLRNYTGDGSTYGLISYTSRYVSAPVKGNAANGDIVNDDGYKVDPITGEVVTMIQEIPQLKYTTPSGSNTYDLASTTGYLPSNTMFFGSIQTQSGEDITGETVTYAWVVTQLTASSNVPVSSFFVSQNEYYVQVGSRTYAVASDAMFYNSRAQSWFGSLNEILWYGANSTVTIYFDQANQIRAIVV